MSLHFSELSAHLSRRAEFRDGAVEHVDVVEEVDNWDQRAETQAMRRADRVLRSILGRLHLRAA